MDPFDCCIVEDVEVWSVSGLLVVAVEGGAASQSTVEVAGALLYASAVAGVVVLNYGDIDDFAGFDEGDVGWWHIALVADLKGAVAVCGWVPSSVGMIPVGIVDWWIEVC